MFEFEGKAICFGDNINTDYIIPSHRKKETINPDELVKYIMEDVRPGLINEIQGPTIFVAGENFGCGSAMEVAAQIVKSANIPVIIAKSFARSYFRNAINNGIVVIEADSSKFKEGEVIHVQMDKEQFVIQNKSTGYVEYRPAYQGKIREILEAGGLVPYVAKLNKGGLNGGN